ncbi:MAG: hypothetical protein ABIW76_09655 [Fibrobacteria bacterium]
MIDSKTTINETDTRKNVLFYGSLGREALAERIQALEDEWDLEKTGAVLLSGAGVLGLVLGLIGSPRWRLLAWATVPLLFLHGRGKWKSAEGLLRPMGFRARREIQEEKYALKAMRGDYGDSHAF